MCRRMSAIPVLTALILPAFSSAQDARSILDTAQQKQIERWEGVNTYVVRQSAMGHAVTTIMNRTIVELDDGSEHTLFMPSHPTASSCMGTQRMTPEQLEQFASAQEMTGDALAGEIETGMDNAGLPKGMLAATGSSPNATFNPRVMMGANAEFLRAAANAERSNQSSDDAQMSGQHMAQFMEQAQLIGQETVNGRNAFHLRADDIDMYQAEDGQEFDADSMSLWIDSEHYVPLRMQIDGTMTAEGQTRPMSIESLMTDYRSVPGSSMYEPYRITTRIAGVLTPEQEQQMREAQAQMADFEQQLASMPESQRAMMESMVGPKIEMIRKMASGGGFESEMLVESIEVNPAHLVGDGDCSNAALYQPAAMGIASSPPAPAANPAAGDSVTAMVQRDLTALGYDTGNTSGVADVKTAVAISQFQAENNLEVTGEASPQLAGILAARVSGSAPATPQDPELLRSAQQTCLEEKVAAAQASQKKKRGMGRLLGGITRAASRLGGGEFAGDMRQVTRDVYDVNATAADFSAAAKDLGLTEDEVAECQNPL